MKLCRTEAAERIPDFTLINFLHKAWSKKQSFTSFTQCIAFQNCFSLTDPNLPLSWCMKWLDTPHAAHWWLWPCWALTAQELSSSLTTTCTENRPLIRFDYRCFPWPPAQCALHHWLCQTDDWWLCLCADISWTVTLKAGWSWMLPQERSGPKKNWTERRWTRSKSLSLPSKRVREDTALQLFLYRPHSVRHIG